MTQAHKSNHSPIERVPNHHSPSPIKSRTGFEGESQKPSRQATVYVVGGTEPSGGKPNHSPSPIKSRTGFEGESQKPSRQATVYVVGGTEPSGGKPNHSPSPIKSRTGFEGESQKPSRQAQADVVGGYEWWEPEPVHSPPKGRPANQDRRDSSLWLSAQVRRWGETR